MYVHVLKKNCCKVDTGNYLLHLPSVRKYCTYLLMYIPYVRCCCVMCLYSKRKICFTYLVLVYLLLYVRAFCTAAVVTDARTYLPYVLMVQVHNLLHQFCCTCCNNLLAVHTADYICCVLIYCFMYMLHPLQVPADDVRTSKKKTENID